MEQRDKGREEAGRGGDAGGCGCWFGWAGRFGWSDDGNFWLEAQQTSLTVLGIVLLYLVIAKGDLILAVVLNPLLFALRGMKSGLTVVTSKITRVSPQLDIGFDPFGKMEARGQSSAKEVLRKWGSDCNFSYPSYSNSDLPLHLSSGQLNRDHVKPHLLVVSTLKLAALNLK